MSAVGHVYAFGDATYHGSESYVIDHERVVRIVATPDGLGYYLVAANGAVSAFGDAKPIRSLARRRLGSAIVGGASAND